MAHQIGARSMGIVPLMQSWINWCCAQSLLLPYDGSYDFSQFSDVVLEAITHDMPQKESILGTFKPRLFRCHHVEN